MLPVSIIIPNFNNEKYIGRCLQSLGALTEDAPEIVICDDASSDASLEVIDSLKLPGIKIIRNAVNVGAARSRHAAIAQARHDHICFLDGDDFLSPGAVGIAYRHLVDHRLDMSLFNMVRTDEPALQEWPFIQSPPSLLDGATAFCFTLGAWKIHPMGVMCKQVYTSAVAGFRFDGFSEDELLTRRLFLASDRILGNPATYYYRQIKKRPSLTRKLGRARTQVAVLEMAIEQAAVITDAGALRSARNQALSGMFKVLRSRHRSSAENASIIDLYHQTISARIGWRMADWRYLLIRIALPVWVLPLRLQSFFSGNPAV